MNFCPGVVKEPFPPACLMCLLAFVTTVWISPLYLSAALIPTASKLDPKGPKHCLLPEVCQVWTTLVDRLVATTYTGSEAARGNILNGFHRRITELSVWEIGAFHLSTQCSKINACHWLSLCWQMKENSCNFRREKVHFLTCALPSGVEMY